jgi:hypothetical protein
MTQDCAPLPALDPFIATASRGQGEVKGHCLARLDSFASVVPSTGGCSDADRRVWMEQAVVWVLPFGLGEKDAPVKRCSVDPPTPPMRPSIAPATAA